MFRSEVRFYREVAPVINVRVARCLDAEITAEGTRLVLEDLSSWAPGADPATVAVQLRQLHDRWEGTALSHWPWLRQPGRAADLIGALYDELWPGISQRDDMPARVRRLGQALVGQVEDAEYAEGTAGPMTLCHGDTSNDNLVTGPDGEVAFLDWEDVRCASGVTDLAWFLVSSVDPDEWGHVEAVYGGRSVEAVLPSVAAQGLFAVNDHPVGHELAAGWMQRLDAAAERLGM